MCIKQNLKSGKELKKLPFNCIDEMLWWRYYDWAETLQSKGKFKDMEIQELAEYIYLNGKCDL
jgi:hypothetical protein